VNLLANHTYMSVKLYPSYHMFIVRILKDLLQVYYLLFKYTILVVIELTS